ncbi:sulfatase-like hydrolase/transferase [Paracoccus aerodenitrificans]|uniref:sulfatase-like hydrolase/transferase n=1 Tax=Paracoccus aerodenitrificans TaxID=3017781 RepID=UPI0022F0564A|nr:sulfatase-like hydrolase/transferase [Paracoccus aerodenitrificans]WBU63650.1 sulfatase-like hydrolase/transferase [Paracoccus aerodenitrificans]
MKKNILVISFDDAIAYWRYKTIFSGELKTPNLDRICQVSSAFHSAYCQSPLCGPSRASLMSSQPPHVTGVHNNAKAFQRLRPQDTWSYQLKVDGYFCSSGGKIHHGYKPLPQEVHDILYSDERKYFSADMKHNPNVPADITGGSGGGVSTTDPKDDARYYDDQSANSFINFISIYDRDQPFYREVGFFSPHTPFMTPKRFKDLYKPSLFEYPPEWSAEIDPEKTDPIPSWANFKTHKTRYWKLSIRNYFSAMSHGDYHLGRVWDALQASEHAKNTIVIILADHGMHLGEKRRFGKSTLLEQVANVPLIIYDPDSPRPQRIEDPVALLDVGPTVLNIANLPEMEGRLGRSLVPLMNGTKEWPDRTVPTLKRDSASVRKGRYRFIRYETGECEMYDLQNDWWQMAPLEPDHPDYDEVFEAHLACCRAHGLDFNEKKSA